MFLLDEDEALKSYLEGMTVTDYASAQDLREVGVRFSMPDKEPADREFPFIVLSLMEIRKSTFREMRGIYPYSENNYYPNEEVFDEYRTDGALEGDIVWADWPIPHDLYYMIQIFSRYDLHDRELQAQMIRRVPYRGGWVPINECVHLMELMSARSADVREQEKRTFRKLYMVRLESELSQEIAYRKAADITDMGLVVKWGGTDLEELTNTETVS